MRSFFLVVSLVSLMTVARAGALAEAAPAAQYTTAAGSRTFAITYVAHVAAPPPGTQRLRVWLPVPATTPVQTISALTFSRPATVTRGGKYGNRYAYWEIDRPSGATEITMRFVCTRRELRTNLRALAAAGEGVDRALELATFHQPSRLAVVNERTRALARQIVAGHASTLDRAHAIYAYVLAHMRYDKSGTGWGNGSTAFACDSGRGNCTDFHSLFDSLCQSAGIGAEFEIGLLLPYEPHSSKAVGGYHCWTYFRVPGRTWVPIDCSEASLEPSRRNYFFGSQTNNRVTLSVGRDLRLVPEQAGAPLNYFIDPYAEADDRPVTATKTWTFTDLD